MKLSALFASLFAAAAVAQNGDFNGYKPITLKFHDAAFSYKLDMYADGNNYETKNDSVINIIESPSDFDAYNYCNFYYPSGSKPALGDQGNGMIGVGPPTTITSVSCRPTPNPPGTCLPVYASCQWCGGGTGGCFVLNCCSGYCAATKCRPT